MLSYDRDWSPPPEPDIPPVPYRTGHVFTARRVHAPRPFCGKYYDFLDTSFLQFLERNRHISGDTLYSGLVNQVLPAAAAPLPCEDLGESATFEIHDEITVGHGSGRGRGSQVFTCTRAGSKEPMVAKVFDPLYYPLVDQEVGRANSVVLMAEADFTTESAAYSQLNDRLGGRVIPKFHGSWVLDTQLKGVKRAVGFVRMEFIPGTKLLDLDPRDCTQEQLLRVMALTLEADVEMDFAGVRHDDIAARNIICSSKDLDQHLRVRIIDFNMATVFPCLGIPASCDKESLPTSPLETFWNRRPAEILEWVPHNWALGDWNNWLKDTWEGSNRYKPISRPLKSLPAFK